MLSGRLFTRIANSSWSNQMPSSRGHRSSRSSDPSGHCFTISLRGRSQRGHKYGGLPVSCRDGASQNPTSGSHSSAPLTRRIVSSSPLSSHNPWHCQQKSICTPWYSMTTSPISHLGQTVIIDTNFALAWRTNKGNSQKFCARSGDQPPPDREIIASTLRKNYGRSCPSQASGLWISPYTVFEAAMGSIPGESGLSRNTHW